MDHALRTRMGTAAPGTVALLRALQVGDLLCAVPAFRSLRAALPDSRVVLVGLPWARAFVQRFARYLDDFVEFPGYPGLLERTPDPARIPTFLAEIQRARFDLVVQMHGSGDITNPVVALFGARAIAGFYRPGHYCPDAARFLPYPDAEPEVRRLLDLARFLGAPPRGEYLEFPIDDADRADARIAAGTHLARGRYACLHPGSRVPERRWTPEGFARVGDAIARNGFHVVLTGTEEEAAVTGAVAARMSVPVVDLAGRTSLGALAAIVAGARLLVCNDTGVSHIADALGVPSVVIFSGSDPRRWAPFDRVKHRRVVVGAAGGGEAGDEARRDAAERALSEVDDLLRAEGLYAA